MIAGAAAQGGAVELGGIGRTLVWIALFLAAMAWLGHPLLKLCFRVVVTLLWPREPKASTP